MDEKYIIRENISIREALCILNTLSGDALTLLVVDECGVMVGTLTDGDIRRKLVEGIGLDTSVSEVMHKEFRFLREKDIDVNTVRLCRERGIALLPCLNSRGKICAVYNLKKDCSVLPVEAVLMAGGKGERLRPLTQKVPKPLLKIGDKAIIDYNVERLSRFGVKKIYVTVNYLAEQIEKHYANKREEVKVCCVREKEFLGTLGAVRMIEDFTQDTVLIMNSDLFTNIDFEDFYLYFKENQADMAVAAIPYSVAVPYGIFDLKGEEIKDIKEKPVYNFYANSGIYLVKKQLLSLIPPGEYMDATDFIRLLIDRQYKVVRFPLTGYWIDIGKPEDFKKAQEFAKHL